MKKKRLITITHQEISNNFHIKFFRSRENLDPSEISEQNFIFTEQEDVNSSNNLNIGLIAGVIAGAATLIAVVATVIYKFYHQHHQERIVSPSDTAHSVVKIIGETFQETEDEVQLT